MKKLVTMTLCMFLAFQAKSQALGYRTAVGWRFGTTQGLTIKAALRNDAAFEGILALWPYSMGITGLYEINKPTRNRGLNWYYGVGGHINWLTTRNYYFWPEKKFLANDPRTAFGVDGIIGIEYRIPRSPVAFSLDLKPTFNFYNDGQAYAFLDPGLGLKFVF